MVKAMRFCCAFLVLMSLAAHGVAAQTKLSKAAASPEPSAQLAGRWRVKFKFSGSVEKNLIFESKARGAGSFQLLDTGPDDKPVADPQPAAWSQLTNDRVSFSGEAELPIGTCCREMGTLIFKGKFSSNDSMSGKLIFVTSVDEEESPYKFRSVVGTFTATRALK